MKSNEFEHAFSEFIDGQSYENTSAALFDLVRDAFDAGWRGGMAHQSSPKDTTAEDSLYMARLMLLHNAVQQALDALKDGNYEEAKIILQEGVDQTDGMISYWDPNQKDYDEAFASYLFA